MKQNPRIAELEGVQRRTTGWVFFAKIGGKVRWSTTETGSVVDDPHHRLSRGDLRTRQEAWKVAERERAQRAMPGGDASAAAPVTLAAELAAYAQLPQVKRLRVFQDGSRMAMLEKLTAQLLAHVGAPRARLQITKQEWETVLGQLQDAGAWKAGTYDNYLTALQDFYTELHDPNSLAGNPVRLIARQKDPGAVAAPSDIPYPTIIRVLARVTANVANRVSFQQDQLARRLAAQGESRCAIARVIGTSETAVRKLLRRPPLVTARDGERCALALSVMAWTGIRPVQFDKITAFQFKPAEQTVWITQSLKRDRSFEKQLDAYGVAAFQAVADAQAWGPYDRKNALRMWKRAWRDEELPEPAPPPYKLRHSYVTAAMRDGALSPEEMCLNTGHGSPEQLKRTYGVNAHGRMRRKAAGAFAEGVAKQIAEAAHAAPPRQRGGVVVFPKAKKGAAVRGAAAGAKPGKRLAKG